MTLSWMPERATSGQLFRVYRQGELLTETAKLTATDGAVVGTTILYSVRVADPNGYLSAAQTIRVLVGGGVVDEHGERIPDTIRLGERAADQSHRHDRHPALERRRRSRRPRRLSRLP